MKNAKMIVTMFLLALAALSLATNAFSQREMAGDGGGNPPPPPEGMPAGPPPPMPGLVVMHAGTNGLFVLGGPALTKYNADTLQQAGTLQLGEKAAGEENGNQPPMGAPGTFIISGDGDNEMILAVIGNEFYRIDTKTFTVAVKSPLPELQLPQLPDGAGQPGRRGAGPTGGREANADNRPGAGDGRPERGGNGGPGGPGMGFGPGRRLPQPLLELHGTTLYVLRANQLLSINIEDGKLIAQGTTSGKLMGGAPR